MSIHVVTVADAVADQLRRRLLSGHYSGGDQLRDTELSQEFGVARPTVRAAVQTLVAEGLLDRGRGRSAQVRSFTADDAIDLGRLRRPVELVAVEVVVTQDRPLTGIASAAQAFSALGDDVSWDVVADHDVAFHRAVFEAAGSARLLRTFDELSAELRLLIAQLRPTYESVADLAHEHELLLAALRSGDLQRVRAAWNGHCDDSERFYLDLIQEHTR
ncbi:GntR family transcriptional regulator [Nonomuraea sp. KC401]|uniref:GntR family transcriptional regulator n=1 Tax=unclassified Nonomuraea TaxID=2593643 RepID=UPI0010FF4864|nr:MULTISPECIES: GntR family transcriptional regulator [unclassified Nonomuraea]NBE95299.1 GntR family transcriptional regulator [Nonomuraea sp. K271]TLF72394.1 GntR family transcriptional regulator [Nonomuraea sp. KC401]